ncbi:RluA family pseudouridine synthase [Desulfopila aestuarii]|uniref:23S rRNA pseudouridine1911/1915/1917 synthase n=1 Tax=Desulfopila aestuarii DSM 18488 TaxID=1121416 RepID=A0A1M7Y8N7_9BACT|nr:RluA family pseudouridine synthase [Desulfopila aestuarii]SHO48990.1 23S rRNA pseudouridine1911/1915/1917 synthase [Desulfopila aestuarii DSM 18488]
MNILDPETVLFEDNHLLVVNKPAGLLTQPVPDDNRDSLEEMAKAYLKEVYNKPGRVYLHAVHRIDRQVSGLVIFARTDKALSRLNQAMRDKRITKIYHALVEGSPGPPGVTIQLKNHLSHRSHHALVTHSKTADSREATLTYTVLKKNAQLSLVQIDLDTGRYHQIRAQLAYAGFPILGDKKYGSANTFGTQDAIGLHSYNTRFPHPVRAEELNIIAPYPIYWQGSSQGLIS